MCYQILTVSNRFDFRVTLVSFSLRTRVACSVSLVMKELKKKMKPKKRPRKQGQRGYVHKCMNEFLFIYSSQVSMQGSLRRLAFDCFRKCNSQFLWEAKLLTSEKQIGPQQLVKHARNRTAQRRQTLDRKEGSFARLQSYTRTLFTASPLTKFRFRSLDCFTLLERIPSSAFTLMRLKSPSLNQIAMESSWKQAKKNTRIADCKMTCYFLRIALSTRATFL